MHAIDLNDENRKTLLTVARESIQYGINNRAPLPIDLATVPDEFKAQAATFITLTLNGKLRGCVGSLTARQPLIKDIAANAFSAAAKDTRFPPVADSELADINIQVSLLSAPIKMGFNDEQDLISKITPKVDGLIILDKGHTGTFLPSVWEQLPTPSEFLNHLKLKAGLAKDHWSDTLEVYKYSVDCWNE